MPKHPITLPVHAVRDADFKSLRHIVAAHPELIDSQDDDGCTALEAATYLNKLEMLAFLLEHHADPNKLNHFYRTPLFYAAMHDHQEAARMLLKYQANPNVQDLEGSSPLIFSLEKFSVDGMIRILLEAGADPNTQNRHGNHSLILSIRHQSLPLIQLLLERGANPLISNRLGETAISLAQRRSYLEGVDLMEQFMMAKAEKADLEVVTLNAMQQRSQTFKNGEVIDAYPSSDLESLPKIEPTDPIKKTPTLRI